jgi:hypothetical protein
MTYGAAGSGKTFTMSGSKYNEGIIPRAIDEVFNSIETVKKEYKRAVFSLEMSYCELYNNAFRNLLKKPGTAGAGISPEANLYHPELACHYNDKIEIHETPKTGIFLSGCPKFHVQSADEAKAMIRHGDTLRATSSSSTSNNPRSSRYCTVL